MGWVGTKQLAALAFTGAIASVHPSLGVPKDAELETTMEVKAVTKLVCPKLGPPERQWR